MKQFILACALFSLSAIASEKSVLSRVYLEPNNKAAMDAIAEKFEVVKRTETGFEVILPFEKIKDLEKATKKVQLLKADIHQEIRAMEQADALAGYHNFKTMEEALKKIAFANPRIAKLSEYGKSKDGRPLYALKISDNVQLDEKEPEILITSATHGDELISVEVVLGLIKALTDKNRSERLNKIIENYELFFVPAVNADGYAKKSRYAHGVDPNRQYPWPQKPNRKPVQCIQKIMDFVASRNFVGSMDFHAHGEMIMYPWAWTYDPIDAFDGKELHSLTKDMAKHNGYVYGPISKVIYVAKGSSADYYYWKHNTYGLGIEIGRSKVPASSKIPQRIKDNLESTWTFIEYFE